LPKFDRSVRSAQFSPNGQWVLTVCSDNTMHVWEAFAAVPPTPTVQVAERILQRYHLDWARFSPDGRRIIAVYKTDNGNTVRLWELWIAPDAIDQFLLGRMESPTRGTVSVPQWLPEMSEAVAGERLTEKRDL